MVFSFAQRAIKTQPATTKPRCKGSAMKEEMVAAGQKTPRLGDKEFHVAPMLDVSTREFRYFIRLLTKRSFLWTEMVVAETLRHCDPKEYDQHLAFEDGSHPIVCQIGGNVPAEAALATELVQRYGYDRIDLNAECPSDRVTGRREFGAALMRDIDTAVDMVKSMVATADSQIMPVSVKTRIGVDDEDTFDFLLSYIGRLVEAGCKRFIIHSRKVYTKGLSPAQNRAVPPLNYQRVYALCEAFPQCEFWLNGGIRSLVDARKIAYGSGVHGFEGYAAVVDEKSSKDVENAKHGPPCEACNQPYGSCIAPSPHLSPANLKGVMVGRLAMDNPCALADVDRYMFGEEENPCRTRRELIEKYAQWIEKIYPRRCCDDDPTVTLGRVVGGSSYVPRVRSYCSVCKEYYENSEEEETGSSDASGEENQVDVCNTNLANDSQFTMSQRRHKRHTQKSPGSKMVSSVIDRPLKPILGVFAGLPGNAKFRREIHRLSRDMNVRNCGPGYVLRKAIECISDDILDAEFARCDG